MPQGFASLSVFGGDSDFCAECAECAGLIQGHLCPQNVTGTISNSFAWCIWFLLKYYDLIQHPAWLRDHATPDGTRSRAISGASGMRRWYLDLRFFQNLRSGITARHELFPSRELSGNAQKSQSYIHSNHVASIFLGDFPPSPFFSGDFRPNTNAQVFNICAFCAFQRVVPRCGIQVCIYEELSKKKS